MHSEIHLNGTLTISLIHFFYAKLIIYIDIIIYYYYLHKKYKSF